MGLKTGNEWSGNKRRRPNPLKREKEKKEARRGHGGFWQVKFGVDGLCC